MADTDDTVQERRASYHHGDLRGQLLTVVRELVEAHGPEGFSVAEAARRAGVSTAAPYKHFKDRTDLLNALVSDAMDRLSLRMSQERDRHPPGSLEAVAGIGKAYIEFAKDEPGIFRLMFGLTEGHEEDSCLQEKGEACFQIVVGACAAYLGPEAGELAAARCAYMLWTSVHGHAFLSIDRKNSTELKALEDWDFLIAVGSGILGNPSRG
ncbi:TetR/AcrR family transcriptional regulator [Roseobacter sp. YSTF-M11]|uniref:TetR/AcrR family transcriptional regulator n=1 Tax=Roseobacter insulae TaxID=2859783 RepID=A0A9X1JYF8_9RHOB|nr:TetR/AcrR family transcriptional regulator [Roseobacter insulae]MBW4708135.1 TetR/AcrR family transcriptional regulator [Roseobacter insulae]